jgi:hypothetical protein
MLISRSKLDSLLLTNVCEIRFTRRHLVANRAATRRMWCTKSLQLLNSTNGRISLNYKPPTGNKRYNEATEDTIIVWDIIMQDYRTISMDNCELLQQLPANEEFWKYFNENIYILTSQQKLKLINS